VAAGTPVDADAPFDEDAGSFGASVGPRGVADGVRVAPDGVAD
jgi:hypothetical protein